MVELPIGEFEPEVVLRVTVEEALDCLWRAYGQLPECTRQALLLHQAGGEHQERIAMQLGVDIAAVEKKLMVAIANLELAQIRTSPGA